MFATKELLHIGRRNTIDQNLSRLCRSGKILRVGRGVYMKAGPKPIALPSPQEVALVKATAWGKRIMQSGLDAACKTGLVDEGEQKHVFLTSGCTTSFQSVAGTIHFRKTAPKKVLLGDSNVGTYLKALWHLGKEYCEHTDVLKRLFEPIWGNAFAREDLLTFAGIIPSWLRDKLDMQRYFHALMWERNNRKPIDRVTLAAVYAPGALR